MKTSFMCVLLMTILIMPFLFGCLSGEESETSDLSQTSSPSEYSDISKPEPSDEVVLRFMVMSDVHVTGEVNGIQSKRLNEALEFIYEYAENQEYDKVDLLIGAGDLTNHGTEAQLNELNDIINEKLHDDTKKQFVMGNHEYYNDSDSNASIERFESILEVERNSHIIINGYHFIGFSLNSEADYLQTLDWLKEELDKAAADTPDKPIFVTQHYPSSNTVYGSDAWGTGQLLSLYKKYPQIVNFSGHTHYPINDPRIVHQGDFTSVGVGTLNYFSLEEDTIYSSTPPGYGKAACFFIAEVYSDSRVELKPYDLITSQFYPIEYIMDNPSKTENLIYTNSRYKTSSAPYFIEGTTLEISNLTSNSCTLTFLHAYDNDCMHSYKIDLYEMPSGRRVRSFKIFSDFYLLDRPEKMTYTITGLKQETEYKVTVTAINSFRKTSEKPLEATFTTQSEE